jgi:hypothetical protein
MRGLVAGRDMAAAGRPAIRWPMPPAFEQIDPALRFECWSAGEACRLGEDSDSADGYVAGLSGASCPGAARSDALGWEIGAICARRVAVSPWLLVIIAQTDVEHLRAIGLPSLH